MHLHKHHPIWGSQNHFKNEERLKFQKLRSALHKYGMGRRERGAGASGRCRSGARHPVPRGSIWRRAVRSGTSVSTFFDLPLFHPEGVGLVRCGVR